MLPLTDSNVVPADFGRLKEQELFGCKAISLVKMMKMINMIKKGETWTVRTEASTGKAAGMSAAMS